MFPKILMEKLVELLFAQILPMVLKEIERRQKESEPKG